MLCESSVKIRPNLKGDLTCQLQWAGHPPGRPGLAAHYHGREGSFSALPSSSHLAFFLTSSSPPGPDCGATRWLISAPPTDLTDSSSPGESPELPTAMSALGLLILGLLSAVPPASCQQGLGNLQPWMQGLIAMAVFLVLVAIAFAVNHFWCQEEPEPVNMVVTVGNKEDGILAGTEGKYSSMAASFRSDEHENAYENVPEEEGKVRSTPM
ncbi:hypothetical protein QTO34_018548 [Cnephaeus nilssonii]|uniref:PDZK1-interacting protein 1 n=2 Tax=Vespertilionidae TaxID=9431 RepID=A0AA40HZ11_CNENI|nr:hypothetical protein QTO34_018548 [Eptesicus nilssonii]